MGDIWYEGTSHESRVHTTTVYEMSNGVWLRADLGNNSVSTNARKGWLYNASNVRTCLEDWYISGYECLYHGSPRRYGSDGWAGHERHNCCFSWSSLMPACVIVCLSQACCDCISVFFSMNIIARQDWFLDDAHECGWCGWRRQHTKQTVATWHLPGETQTHDHCMKYPMYVRYVVIYFTFKNCTQTSSIERKTIRDFNID